MRSQQQFVPFPIRCSPSRATPARPRRTQSTLYENTQRVGQRSAREGVFFDSSVAIGLTGSEGPARGGAEGELTMPGEMLGLQ